MTSAAWQLLDEERLREAWRLGLGLRLGYTLSGGAPEALKQIRVERDAATIRLVVPTRCASLLGEAVHRRLDALAEAHGRKAKIKIGR